MSPLSRSKLGDYILCPLNQQLEYSGQCIPLEPKVYEVLCYLVTHHQRFVSLDELHKEVWQGRVVSDTAVRRTISKLRAALNDQGDAPRYIQSAAKRGYRWLVPLVAVETNSNATPEVNTALSTEPLTAANVITSSQSSTLPGKQAIVVEASDTIAAKRASFISSKLKLIISSSALLCMMLVFVVFFVLEQKPGWQQQSHLALISGEKLSMAVSPDQRFLVFSSNAMNHFGQELYWYNLASQELKQLTTGDSHIMQVAFAADGKHLFYHNFKDGAYQLIQQAINEQGDFIAEGKVLLDNIANMFKIWVDPDNESLLLNLGDSQQSNIQRLHLPTGALTPVTSSLTTNVHDVTFAVELNSSQLAFQRYVPGQGRSLIIQNMLNGRMIQQYLHNAFIYDMHWLNQDNLLIVDEEAISTFNVHTQQHRVLQQNYQTGNVLTRGLTRMVVPLGENEWLQFQHEGDVGRMLHQQGQVGLFSGRSYVHADVQTRAMFFSNAPQELFLYNLEENKSSLMLRLADGTQQRLFEVNDGRFSVQQLHPEGESLLLLLNGKPTLFDLQLRQLIPLDVIGNSWLSARFSQDGQAVIMTSMQNSEYQTWLYQLATGESKLKFQGYQLVVPYQAERFVAVHPDSRFLLLEGSEVTTLPVTYSPPFPGSVHVRGDYLFWAETDLKHTTLFRFNLATSELQQWQQDRRQMIQSFDISPDGTRWLLRHIGQFDTKVYRVNADIR